MTDGTTPLEGGEEVSRLRSGIGITIAFLVPVLATGIGWSLAGRTHPRPAPATALAPAVTVEQAPPQVPVPSVTAAQLAALVEATTWTTVASAPIDADRQGSTTGLVVHNTAALAVFDKPGGQPIARLPERQGASATWLPVIDGQPGWFQVLLPAKPAGASGWIDATAVQVAKSAYEIRIQLAAMTLELWRDGQLANTWRTSPGKTDTPTPLGRTFILAAIRDDRQTYSPVIVPLGTHSGALDSFSGGPGTIAIHTWPSDSVMGTAASHGCVRIPQEAMAVLLQAPAGTLVRINP